MKSRMLLTFFIIIIVFLSALLLYKNRTVFLEGFESIAAEASPQTRLEKQYSIFIDFYSRFCNLWSDSINKGVNINNNEPVALTSPSQTKDINTTYTPPNATTQQRDVFIYDLSAKTGKEYPVCMQFPLKLDDSNLRIVKDTIPGNNHPYINALQWMNDKLRESSKNLDVALSGGSMVTPIQETFVDSYDKYDVFTLYNMKNDSRSEGFASRSGGFASQLDGFASRSEGFASRSEGFEDISPNCAIVSHGGQIQPDNPETRCDIEASILKKLDSFLTDKEVLMQLLMDVEENKKKADSIGKAAQNGDLIKQIKIEEPTPFLAKATGAEMPSVRGGSVSKIDDIKKNDPQAYESMLKNNKSLVQLGSLLDSINRELR